MEIEEGGGELSDRLKRSIDKLGTRFAFRDGRRPEYFGLLELESKPFWTAKQCGPDVEALLATLATKRDALRAEVAAARDAHRIARDVESNGQWSIRYVSRDGQLEASAPATLRSILAQHAACVPSLPFCASIVSFLGPHGKIKPHYGPTNLRLRLQFPLSATDDCRLFCGDEQHAYADGYAIIDDAYLHWAENASPELERIMLIVDIWHPGVVPGEREAITQLFQTHL